MSKTAKESMKGIVVTIDRVEGTNDGESVARYERIKKALEGNFDDLRIRVGCALSTLKSAPPVKDALKRRAAATAAANPGP
jgi:hypothetical protein